MVLLHGLLGDYDRDYMRLLTRHYRRQRLSSGAHESTRGGGFAVALSPELSWRFYAGSDRHGPQPCGAADTGSALAWIGISLSGNMLLKAASETAFCGAADHEKLVSISAPFDLARHGDTVFSGRETCFTRAIW